MKIIIFSLIQLMVLTTCPLVGLSIFSAAPQEPVECGPKNEKIKVKAQPDIHPLPTPSPGKALIYVIEGNTQTWASGRIALNGHWMGDTLRNSYFFFETEPGLLKFCSKVGVLAPRFLYLTVEAGKTYYIHNGTRNRGDGVFEIKEELARRLLEGCRYITITVEAK